MIPLLCELLKPIGDFVAPPWLRITVLRNGNRSIWGRREAASYPTCLGLGFLIWKVMGFGGPWTGLDPLSFVWSLPVRKFSGGFPVICFVLGLCCSFCFKRRKRFCFSSGYDWEPLQVPPFKVLFLREDTQKRE